jgi:methylglyoxal reductase
MTTQSDFSRVNSTWLTRTGCPRVIVGTMWHDVHTLDDTGARRRVDAALEADLHTFDTAPLYGFGRAEELLGAALRGRRERALVLGKVGLRWDSEHGEVMFRARGADQRELAVRKDSRPSSVKWEVEQSLKRLATDHLDLVQVHQRDRLVPVAETLGALLELHGEGKVRAIGVSNFDAEDTREAARVLGAVKLASNQVEYSALRRGAERDIAPTLSELDVALLAYSPTARGLLGGSSLAARATTSRYAARVQSAVKDVLQPLAGSRGWSVAQLSLAWVLAQPFVDAAIIGARDEEQLREAAHVLERGLTGDEVEAVRRALDGIRPELNLDPLTRTWRALRAVARAAKARLRDRR